MPQITSTELGGAGRFIDLGSAAGQDDIGPQTTIAYVRLTAAQSVVGYLLSKCDSAAANGVRTVVSINNTFALGASSSGAITNPDGVSTDLVNVLGAWQHLVYDWDGTVNTTGIKLYKGGGSDTRGSGTTGSGTINSDAANNLFLLNRVGLGRHFEGATAYIARWSPALSPARRANAIANGPLSEPDGMLVCWANQQDYGPQGLVAISRSIHAAGALPPNLELGTPPSVTFACAMACTSTATATLTTASAAFACAMACTSTATATLPAEYLLDGAYERSSINIAGCSIVGSGDSAIIQLDPKVTAGTNGIAHMNFGVKISGLLGKRPTFRLLRKDLHNFGGLYHATRRPMLSYNNGVNSIYFDTDVTVDVGNNWIQWRNSTPFTQDSVLISENRQRSVHQLGTWLQNLASTYSFVQPTTTAVAWTPTASVSGYDAQNFIGSEFPSDVDSLGVACGVTPFYCAQINDTSLMPYNGVKKVAVIHGGRHAGEDMGDVAMQHTVEWICGNSHEARELRRNFRILIYPMCTAQGRATGGYRGTTNGQDPNRLYNTTGSMAAVDQPKVAEVTDRAGGVTSWYISYHGSYQVLREIFTGGSALDLVYINKLIAIGGFAINNGGSAPADRDVGWYNSVGYKVSVVAELGDHIPMTDAELLSHGQALGKSFSAMSMEGQFDGFAASMTCASTASATINATPAPFACNMACASTAAAAVTTQITMQAAMACSSTASATATTTSTPFACNMACASASAASVITQIRMQAAMTCRSMASASISSPSPTYYRASRAYAVPAVSRRYAVTAPDAA